MRIAGVPVVLGLLLAVGPARAVPPCWSPCAVPDTLPGVPIAIGDLNGDGRDDLVTAAAFPIEYSVWFGTPTGLPPAPATVVTSGAGPESARAVAVADLDGDGIGDLVVAERDFPGAVRVLFGRPAWPAAASLEAFPPDVLELTGGPSINPGGLTGSVGVAAGDLDGDGFSDLAVSYGFDNSAFTLEPDVVHVFFGPLAAGTRDVWSARLHVLMPITAHHAGDKRTHGLVLADLDGDGSDDLAVGTDYPLPAGGMPEGAALRILFGRPGLAGIVDWEADHPDLGVFAGGPDSGFATTLSAGDLDPDDQLDLIAGAPHEGPEAAVADRRGTVFLFHGPIATALREVTVVRGATGDRLAGGLVGHERETGAEALYVRSLTADRGYRVAGHLRASTVEIATEPDGVCSLDARPLLAGDFDADGRLETVAATRAGWRVLGGDGGSDSTPPRLRIVSAPTELWAPNHRYVALRLGVDVIVEATDDCDPAPVTRFLEVSSNEDENGRGDGNTAPDAVVEDDVVWLRAERSGTGAGRVYGITLVAEDASGNRAGLSFMVTVAHDRRAGPLPPGTRPVAPRRRR